MLILSLLVYIENALGLHVQFRIDYIRIGYLELQFISHFYWTDDSPNPRL